MRLTPFRTSKQQSRRRLAFVAMAVCTAFLAAPVHAPAVEQVSIAPPDSLTDAEFWAFFTTHSEEGGYFLSENFVSNEVSFQDVIPTLQQTLTKDGVYLGVGPEQNFTYIANLAPRMAVIFDIRRQNALQHLMYKALFELSATRNEFVARLFSRPGVSHQPNGIAVRALFDSAEVAAASDSAYSANFSAIVDQLVTKHGFALSAEDIATIRHVYNVFFSAGPLVNYGYRSGSPMYARSTYPTFGTLQAATNADSVQMAFLASEENYQAIRRLQLRNLIVPVVGDFGGPSAIRKVGKWLTDRHMTVTAFYVSNVEQYLFREPGASDRFYINVSSLPLDTTSRFIRSVPGMGGLPTSAFTTSGQREVRLGYVVTRDAVGRTTTQTFRDSAGVTLMQTTRDTVVRDSAAVRALAARDSAFQKALRDMAGADTTLLAQLRQLNARRDSINGALGQWQVYSGPVTTLVRGGGLLASGLAPMKATLQAYFMGELKDYNHVVATTKVSGWR